MSSEQSEEAEGQTTGVFGALAGVNALTKLIAAVAGLVTAGATMYHMMPAPAPSASATASAAAPSAALPPPPTRSYIQLASFPTKEAAEEGARRQSNDLLRQVCVFDSRGVFATAVGPMLTTDANELVLAFRQHATVNHDALVLPGKTYVSTGTCFSAKN